MLDIAHEDHSEVLRTMNKGISFTPLPKANPSLPLKACKNMLTKELPPHLEVRSSLLPETRTLIFLPINRITQYALFPIALCTVECFFCFSKYKPFSPSIPHIQILAAVFIYQNYSFPSNWQNTSGIKAERSQTDFSMRFSIARNTSAPE